MAFNNADDKHVSYTKRRLLQKLYLDQMGFCDLRATNRTNEEEKKNNMAMDIVHWALDVGIHFRASKIFDAHTTSEKKMGNTVWFVK